MSDPAPFPLSSQAVLRVGAGRDRSGGSQPLGISRVSFKVTAQESTALFCVENTFHARGGPARHLHHAQDEWFYALEGEFIIEVGAERFQMGAGDSLLAPRELPHVWAFVGEGRGRMLIVFSPAGQMEAFFRAVGRHDAMPPQTPELWRAHGMELLGPPLPVG